MPSKNKRPVTASLSLHGLSSTQTNGSRIVHEDGGMLYDTVDYEVRRMSLARPTTPGNVTSRSSSLGRPASSLSQSYPAPQFGNRPTTPSIRPSTPGSIRSAPGGYPSEIEGGPPKRLESAWKRRHSTAAAKKTTEWADLFMSTAATEDGIAAFLSFKDDKSNAADAEYFFNLVPKAVYKEDMLYKQLLAVFNAFKFWARALAGRRLLLSCADAELAKLLKSWKLKPTLGKKKAMMLQDIMDSISRLKMDFRIIDIDSPECAIAYWLCRSQFPACKRQFEAMLEQEDQTKGKCFNAVEKFFPPMYV